jgi:protein TonB
MAEGTVTIEGSGETSLASSFGIASALLIAGVLAAWVAILSDVEPALPSATERVSDAVAGVQVPTTIEGQSLLEQAELAFAAGRIVEPEFDNALAYYLALLETDPENTAAREGVGRVMGYLESEAEGAIFRSDWDAARAYADAILEVRTKDENALGLRQRIDRLERVDALTARAFEQFSSGRLVAPPDDNAAESYRAVLALDPANEAAKQGLRSVVQRLVASAQSAAFAGDFERAERFVAQVRSVDPQASGLTEVQSALRRTRGASGDGSAQSDLARASQALEADRLVPPAEPNAFDLFSAVLARDPASEAARRGLDLVRAALVERVRTQIAKGDIAGIQAALIAARTAAVDPGVLAELEPLARHAVRLAKARAGEFDDIRPIGTLAVVRQVAPDYPRSAASRGLEGWVEVEFTVTETGEVRDALVRESSASVFDNAAVSAVNRWRFEPVLEEGQAVPVRTRARFTFREE